MSTPVGALLEGLSVAGMHAMLIAGILLILVLSQFFLYVILRRIFGEWLTSLDYLSLSLSGWLIPALLISLLWYAVATVLSPEISLLAVLLLLITAGLLLFVRSADGTFRISKAGILVSLSLLIFFLLLRLAFLSRALLPLYFDSAQHYRFIDEILRNIASDLPQNYYHLGFHFLAAFISFMIQAEISDTMLALGQILLALMPFSVFFPVWHATGSTKAGFFAIALAAFGWYMPAHAVDWGKYPALASLALLPFVPSLAYLSSRYKNSLSRPSVWGLYSILLAGMLVSVFLHSRTLVVLGILAFTWLLTSIWRQFPKPARTFVLVAAIVVLLVEIIYIQTRGILGPLFDPYGMKAILITGSVLILAIFAWQVYPGLVFFCIAASALLVASLFIPLVDVIPGYATTTLLDRPYVEMILYLPLSCLGGFGLAALEQRLAGRVMRLRDRSFNLSQGVSLFFILLVAVHAWFKYDLYPSDCCDIVSEDDLAAIHWMDENLPGEARILAASTDLNVLPTDEFQGTAGGDAGTWIPPLIKRQTLFMPFTTDFSQQQTLETLCQMQVNYVYVGGTGSYFDDAGMLGQPGGYRVVFALPKARVYEVTGCV